MNKRIVPEPPKKQVVIPQKARKNLEKWVVYLKNMSPRVHVITSEDKDFSEKLEKCESSLKKAIQREVGGEIELLNWSEEKDVALIVAIDSAVQGEEPCFLLEHGFILCYENTMLTLHQHWNWSQEDWLDNTYYYQFEHHDTSWEEAVRLIGLRLEGIEEKIPFPPKG